MRQIGRSLLRLGALLLLGGLALQLYFAARIALMMVIAAQSTSFQRSEAWRLGVKTGHIAWTQQWVDDKDLSKNLKRAVIASEDAGFVEHGGVEWDALEKAWARNQREELRAEKRLQTAKPNSAATAKSKQRAPKVIGGSTISQQLAKNLFLSGERNFVRKGQEFVITLLLEAMLSKQRILEIYLNNVEWGEGVFGAQAAARHYFHIDAKQLSAGQAARLAVMLPAPKRFERNPASPYVLSRAATIEARMGAVELP
ncbi:monofunctional biosynthetic peptidoglycan transglycosylase [Roseateles oligotrophus]|uniref:Biosynthetic peptidoglycan transglycosylase n=1 Tax=Roseateles oligotrophus TaxID=1769250 RepID=A0ABT2YJ48_9BURK|nr:monofunctional biosynthetic peptidoglycan transglycosylase [Roseateles oligotrophus]MCV2370048.1 monofunctional biosynthetic peptidoglycan transglycosylase [Roseateles oligotrophus]